ncbi:hypothetical protein [Methylophilus aquaticus]|uniref:Uncharacterized protein n=1 Tax=Methylophilus aquaticus TaxID=1971610 RepID=A0ABT9JP32_9PROT|nr:hypothetical protein [Methylophilus aquaticus]MDP8566347.1 hypothetical protein [Methylophilus aquaticus]
MRYIISTAVLVSGLVAAMPVLAFDQEVSVEHKAHAQQFLSKRPYANPVVLAKAGAEQGWVGASLVVGQDQALKQQHIMKMHMIGKRAY